MGDHRGADALLGSPTPHRAGAGGGIGLPVARATRALRPDPRVRGLARPRLSLGDRRSTARHRGGRGRACEQAVRAASGGNVAVVVVAPGPSGSMRRVGDEVTPLIVATGTAEGLLGARGAMRTLTSDTTRRTGLVANVDVAPAILHLFGVAVPPSMDGTPVRVVDSAAPFALHRRHLEQRRIRLPIQLAEVAFVGFAFFLSVAALIALTRGRRLTRRASVGLRSMVLAGVALAGAAGGGRPPAAPHLLVGRALRGRSPISALVWLAVRARWPGVMGPLVFLGAVGAAELVLDAMFGWRGAAIPLLGGTMFDGARFYGLPNAFEALLLASALFLAVEREPFTGVVGPGGRGPVRRVPLAGSRPGRRGHPVLRGRPMVGAGGRGPHPGPRGRGRGLRRRGRYGGGAGGEPVAGQRAHPPDPVRGDHDRRWGRPSRDLPAVGRVGPAAGRPDRVGPDDRAGGPGGRGRPVAGRRRSGGPSTWSASGGGGP